MKLVSQGLIFLIIAFMSSISFAKPVKAVQCDWFSDKVPIEIRSRKELTQKIREQKCDLSKVNWKKEWVYFYRNECQSLNDKFIFVNFKKGVLSLVHQHQDDQSKENPDILCSRLAVCGKSGVAVIFQKGQKVEKINIEKETVPCGRVRT